MNSISCEIIQDLLPLYCDGVCSEESKKIILAHVQTCDKCREELRMMELPIDILEENGEVKAAEAASKAWKKNKRKAFQTGIILVALLVLIVVTVYLSSHYMQTSGIDDVVGLEQQMEKMKMTPVDVQNIVQKGDYLAVSGYDDNGLLYLGIYVRDDIFSDRWKISGGLSKVKPGKLVNWNYETPEGDTILVCFGAEFSDDICGYTFTNSGVTYTCSIKENGVLDIFFIQDTYDSYTYLEPIYQP